MVLAQTAEKAGLNQIERCDLASHILPVLIQFTGTVLAWAQGSQASCASPLVYLWLSSPSIEGTGQAGSVDHPLVHSAAGGGQTSLSKILQMCIHRAPGGILIVLYVAQRGCEGEGADVTPSSWQLSRWLGALYPLSQTDVTAMQGAAATFPVRCQSKRVAGDSSARGGDPKQVRRRGGTAAAKR